jgi:adenylyltransferase/sulfurtransferase
VLGVLPGLVGTIQATEAIKLILRKGNPLIGRLLLIDALTMEFRTIALRKDPECPACGTREIRELIDYEAFCGTGARMNKDDADVIKDIDPVTLSNRLEAGDDIQLLDVREPWEWQIARIPGARLIPLGNLPAEIDSLDAARDTVIYCKSGVRSLYAAQELESAGFKKLSNLAGGILRWSQDVDPAVPRY